MALNSTYKLNKSIFSNNDRISKFTDKLNVNKNNQFQLNYKKKSIYIIIIDNFRPREKHKI